MSAHCGAPVRRWRSPPFAVVGEVSDGEETVELVRELQSAVVLLDVAMPGGGGISTVRKITASGGHSAVVMLAVLDDPALVVDASQAGARGYVFKSRAGTDLAPAIRAALTSE
ncbi:MAG TPA: response regulator transcription factor [Gemmatimonadales bacterium]|nr:response regulator transcription factor [Gemmatimonadales bacterium]